MSTREPQGPKTPVERLVDAGLAAYGRGEVDDALVAWEQALALDPEDQRALGYVDYVRQHYELVTGALAEPMGEEELGVPFGVGDDLGDYEVEITQRRPPSSMIPEGATVRLTTQPIILEALDEGWSLVEDPMSRALTIDSPPPMMTVEMEADEPPEDDFEDRTDEYQRSVGRRRQPGPSSPGFLPAEHPEPATDEFPSIEQTTGLGQRALGFVQPKEPTKDRVKRPELKVTIRTPSIGEGEGEGDLGAAGDAGSPHDPGHTASLSLDHLPPRAMSEGDDALGPALGEEVTPSKRPTLDFGSKSEGPTKDLHLRSKSQSEREAAARVAAAEERDRRAATEIDPSTVRTRTKEARARIVAEVDRNVTGQETADQRTRRRIAALIELAQLSARAMQLDRAIIAIDAAFSEDPDSALAHKLIQSNRDAIFGVFHDYLGDLDRRPHITRALHDVVDEPIDPRAAFLLSRVDGSITFEELLDVSGMPRLEAGRYLCQLLMRGLLAAE